MEFNIHQQVFDEDGDYLEEEGQRYRDQLVELFEASPEAQELQSEGIEPGWTSMLLDYAMSYLEVTPPQMTTDSLQELLFDLVPRKVSAPPEDAPSIIREMQLFWTFLEREFHLENAAGCLKILNEKAVRQLRREMSDPTNFGMAKSFVMLGQERGFDMSTQEGIQEWMQVYNEELARSPGLPFSRAEPWASGAGSPFVIAGGRGTSSRRTSAEKTKRKMAKNSRKQNRKR